ncbi:MAG: helix-turn-helix domain-containing protein [Defluviitaleaceae bacterium]|nr:helix-turn-helix domain-containing protein [Defluviitaleaceae bacterium]
MAVYNIGQVIKKLRIQKEITQEELAFPVIDRATLSKIENGRATPNKQTIKFLFEKLGIKPNNFLDFFEKENEEEKQIDNLVKKLNNYTSFYQKNVIDKNTPNIIKEIDAIIQKLENNNEFFEDLLNKQFIFMIKIKNDMNKGKKSYNDILENIYKVLKMTIPNFTEENIINYFLSEIELKLVVMIAVVHHENKNYKKAIQIYKDIKFNIEKNYIDNDFNGNTRYTGIMHNLAKSLYWNNDFEQCIHLCNEGMLFCRQNDNYIHYIAIASTKATCLYETHNILEFKNLIKNLYFSCDIFEKNTEKENIKEYIVETLGKEFLDKLNTL